MTIKSEKNGYHSTQDVVYRKIPKSEFYGFVVGFALGMILRGLINLSGLFEVNDNYISYVLCMVGLAIGWWVDQKYYMVKDEPEETGEEEAEAAGNTDAETAAETVKAPEQQPEIIEGTSTQDTLKKMFDRNE